MKLDVGNDDYYKHNRSDLLDFNASPYLFSTDIDTTPDAFTFTDQTGVALSTLTTSNTITVSGTNAQAAISVSGGEYNINGGMFTTTAGLVSNGNTVSVRHTSSATNSTTVNTTLTIGGVSDTFTSTTVASGGGSIPVPTTANLYVCEAAPATPAVYATPASAKPMAVTNPTPLDVRVVLQIAAFAGLVDVYVTARLPDGSTLIRSPMSWLPYIPANIAPLRALNTAAIDMTGAADNLYASPLSALPPGAYQGNVIVVPTGTALETAKAFYNWCYTKPFP